MRAEEAAQARREADVIVRADAVAAAAAMNDASALQWVMPERRLTNAEGEEFAAQLVASLEGGRADAD